MQGGCLLAATLLTYVWALNAGRDPDVARTLALVGLTTGNLLLVLVNATVGVGWRAMFAPGSRAFWWVAGVALSALVLAVAVPGARQLLHFGIPNASDLALSLSGVALSVALGAWLSALARRK